jgi:hypothetical protein
MPRPTEDDSRLTSEESDGGISKVFGSIAEQREEHGQGEERRTFAKSGARPKGTKPDEQSAYAHPIRVSGERWRRVRAGRPFAEEARTILIFRVVFRSRGARAIARVPLRLIAKCDQRV